MTAEQKITRKLRALLSADVKGYSTLMANDEVATIQTLKEYREIMSEIIKDHFGNVVDMPGDNILAEFSSVVNAVQSSVAIQKALKLKNNDLPHDKRLEFRIGINIGDVVQDDDNLYGEGVNIAARIEGLAEPGGICISRGAYDHIRNKLNFGYEYIGEHIVKNIKDPVRVYKILMDRKDAGKVIGERLKPSARKWALCAVIALTIIFTIIGYQFYQKLIAPEFETASSENMALPLPDKPSIAVLAFDNMSGNPEQDYFSDGITEDIITDLAKISGLFVISSHSSFRFKDKIVDVQEVGKALGVRFLLDGSIRKDGNRVRINVQLIDTINGSHLWSERYDRELKNVFNLQNEILSEIVTALDVKLVEGEQAKFYRKATDNPQAYDYFAKGISFFRQFKQEANSLARQHLLNAIKLDPEYAEAMGLLGTTHWADARYGWSNSRSQSLQKGKHLAKKALEIDNHSYLALSALSSIYLLERDIDRSLEYRQKAFTVNPNSADSNAMMGWTLSLVGREDEALSYMKTAMKLSPFYPYWYLATLCDIYRLAGRYEDAISTAKAIIDLNLDQVYEPGRLYLSAVLIELGREREARELALEHIKKRPSFSLKRFEKSRMYKDFRVTEKLIGQLRMAGFPE